MLGKRRARVRERPRQLRQHGPQPSCTGILPLRHQGARLHSYTPRECLSCQLWDTAPRRASTETQSHLSLDERHCQHLYMRACIFTIRGSDMMLPRERCTSTGSVEGGLCWLPRRFPSQSHIQNAVTHPDRKSVPHKRSSRLTMWDQNLVSGASGDEASENGAEHLGPLCGLVTELREAVEPGENAKPVCLFP